MHRGVVNFVVLMEFLKVISVEIIVIDFCDFNVEVSWQDSIRISTDDTAGWFAQRYHCLECWNWTDN